MSQDIINPKTVVDIRQASLLQRHLLIFRTFDALLPGETFILVDDHDPGPLYYEFKFEREGQFTWEYLQLGPEIWQVSIGKPR